VILSGKPVRSARTPPLLRRGSAYDAHIQAAAEKYGLPTPLLRAVMAVESNFDPAAVSQKGATGLMQLMPGTARDLAVDDLYDPAQNIEGGARYLRRLQDQFGNDLETVLAAYNAGPEAVRRAGGAVPPFRETQAYVKKVLALYQAYMGAR
jgi:soluble lytic murein transglycosylase-like protein